MSFQHYQVTNDLQTPIIGNSSDMKYDSYLDQLKKLKIKIMSKSEEEIVFDLIGVEAPIANALRRILLAEVPSIAIETVYISDNTSIIPDEVLSHRLGLLPLRCDPTKLDFVQGEEETDSDTVVFQLDVQCPQSHAETDKTEVVYSSQLHWVPQGNQEERFPEGIECVESNITVAMLKAGQRIALEAHARKGIGKDHTKFSPVATASYRLLPDIRFPQPITGDRAQQLVDLCPMKVFDIEDIRGVSTAVVGRPRDCTMCRECIRTEEWTESVTLLRKADHFIFSVESTGVMSPESIIFQGIEVLKEKAITFYDHAHLYAVREGLV